MSYQKSILSFLSWCYYFWQCTECILPTQSIRAHQANKMQFPCNVIFTAHWHTYSIRCSKIIQSIHASQRELAERSMEKTGNKRKQTKTSTQRHAPVTTEACWKWVTCVYCFLFFFFVDTQIAPWVKTGRAPQRTKAEYVHFYFP